MVMSSEVQTLKQLLTEKWFSAVLKVLEEERNEIHVSHLVYDCMRRAYFSLVDAASQRLSLQGVNAVIVGKMMHLIPLLSENEIPLKYEGIVGSVDDYGPVKIVVDGEEREVFVLVDKKFTLNPPRTGVRPHHEKQINFYRVMLEDGYNREDGTPSKRRVDYAFIMYKDLSTYNSLPDFREVMLYPKEEVREEMLRKRDILRKAIAEGVPPSRSPSWECAYCPYFSLCYKEGKGDKF